MLHLLTRGRRSALILDIRDRAPGNRKRATGKGQQETANTSFDPPALTKPPGRHILRLQLKCPVVICRVLQPR